MTGRPNVFVLLFAGQSRDYNVSFGVNFGVFKMDVLLIAVKGKLIYHLEKPIDLSKFSRTTKSGSYVVFLQHSCRIFVFWGRCTYYTNPPIQFLHHTAL